MFGSVSVGSPQVQLVLPMPLVIFSKTNGPSAMGLPYGACTDHLRMILPTAAHCSMRRYSETACRRGVLKVFLR